MVTPALASVTAPRAASLRDVLELIDRSGLAVALLVDDGGTLVGLLTDGDVRRAILRGVDLAEPALESATTSPHTVAAGSSRAHVLDLMKALRIVAVPEVDSSGRVVGLHTLSDVVGAKPLPNPVVIMAGGRGTRLRGLTRATAKPMLEVAGRSILEWIVLNLVGGGVRDVTVSVNHLAEQIEGHLGDGSRFGCSVTYLRERAEQPLGTAGSLAMFRSGRLDLDIATIVMNGDLMVEFEPERLVASHTRDGAAITVGTRPYQFEVPFGVVEAGSDGIVTSIREKPAFSMDVNAGIYAVSPEALDLVPPSDACDMPDLIQLCLDRGLRVSRWALSSDWIDVGTPSDLARAKGFA